MAFAEKMPNGQWRGRYRGRDGVKATVAGGPFRSQAEALREAGAAEVAARRDPARPTARAGRATWTEWADQWWGQRTVEPGTLARDASRRATHLDPRWGAARLDAITRTDVQAWVNELARSGLAAATVANIYHLFSASMKAAVLDGRIPSNPCTSITLPTRPPADERYLTWEEVAAVAHFMDDRDALLLWFLVGTGARWGEAVGAHRHRLHIDRARLDIHEVWDARSRAMKPYPKGRAKRSVPLPGWLVERLVAHLHAAADTGTCGAAHRDGGRCRSGLVIPGRGGGVIDYDAWQRGPWGRAVGRHRWFGVDVPAAHATRSFRLEAEARRWFGPGVAVVQRWEPGLADVGEVRIHDLRHSYASWLVQDGVSIEALSALLGHSSIAVTQRYAHLADTQWAAVRATLDARAPGPAGLRAVPPAAIG